MSILSKYPSTVYGHQDIELGFVPRDDRLDWECRARMTTVSRYYALAHRVERVTACLKLTTTVYIQPTTKLNQCDLVEQVSSFPFGVSLRSIFNQHINQTKQHRRHPSPPRRALGNGMTNSKRVASMPMSAIIESQAGHGILNGGQVRMTLVCHVGRSLIFALDDGLSTLSLLGSTLLLQTGVVGVTGADAGKVVA